MALPLWEECSWMKSVNPSFPQRKLLHEKEKANQAIKEKELLEAQKRKDEEERIAENYRKTLEKNEKLMKLTNALLTPALVEPTQQLPPPPPPTANTTSDSTIIPEDEANLANSSSLGLPGEERPLMTTSRSSVKKTSLFGDDDDENISSRPPAPAANRRSVSKRPSLFGEEGEEETASIEVEAEKPKKSIATTDPETANNNNNNNNNSANKSVDEHPVPVDFLAPPPPDLIAPLPHHHDNSQQPHLNSSQEGEGEAENKPPQYPFPIDNEINSKIFLHLGAGYKIPCNALIVGQNEALNDRHEDNGPLITLAGPLLEEELTQCAPIQTGESCITQGGTLPCDWVIHAVGPRYDERYLTASEHALFSALKSSLVLALEKEAKDIVITCIYSPRKKYPRFDAAHICLRTVRKFLQHKNLALHFQRIMFCVPTQDDYEIYSALLSAYFPRNEEELKDSLNLLPNDLGDEWGQKLLEDRILKVSAGPKPLARDEIQEYRRRHSNSRRASKTDSANNNTHDPNGGGSQDENDFGYEDFAELTNTEHSSKRKTGDRAVVPVGTRPKGMTHITHDEDEIRKARVARELSQLSREERLKLRYQAMVPDIETEPLDDIKALDFLQIIGKDNMNRAVVLLSAADLGKNKTVDPERIILFIMKEMEAFRCRPFILIFTFSGMTEETSPDGELMLNVFDLFAARYQENMQQFYVLHASFSTRMYLWVSIPVLANPYWSTYICCSTIKEIEKYLKSSDLRWPRIVFEHENN